MTISQVRSKAKQTYRNIRAVLQEPPLATPGHYYSPLTTTADGERAWTSRGDRVDDVNIDLAATAELARTLAPMWAELPLTRRYHRDSMFDVGDAAVYHSMLRHFRPSRVVEVGSGFSTAVVLDVKALFGLQIDLTCIEPNTERLQSLLAPDDDVHLVKHLVQDVPLETFDQLAAGDFLFIDSTHVVKAGSDVVWTTLRVLPRLAAGVIVHIHDMFWPFEYQEKWLMQRRDWNEIYLIHAFLSGNPQWEVLLFNDQAFLEQPELVAANIPAAVGKRPGSLWLRKTGGPVGAGS